MKKTALVLLALPLLTLAHAPLASAQQPGWKGWQNLPHGLGFEIPADWKIMVNTGAQFTACEPSNQFCVDVFFSKGKQVTSQNLAIGRYHGSTVHQAKSVVAQRRFSRFVGFNGYQIKYVAQKEGRRLWSSIVGLTCQYNASNVVIQLSWFDHPRFNQVNEQFSHQVARTFKLLATRVE